MRIGIEVQRLFRKKKYGIETSSLELIKKMAEVEPRHQYIIFAKDDNDRACLRESSNLSIKTLSGRIFADFEQIFLPIAAKKESVDVLHCTGNTTPYFSPVPVIQTLHDIIFMDPIPSRDTLYQRIGNLYRRKIVPLVTPRSNVVITVSQYEKQRILSRMRIPEHKVHVVYNGINETHFKVSHNSIREEYVRSRYTLPERFILFLGNPAVRKNPIRVIEAYVRYASKSEAPIALVTPGLSQKFIQDQLKELNMPTEKCRFITPGYIDENDLPVVYGLSEVFLFPSLSEGFGMPVIEAMACGAPVITSKISSMPEIAGNAAMLIDPMSPPSIAEALLLLTNNQTLRADKVRLGIKNVKRFSWKNSAEQVLGIYETVLQPSRSLRHQASPVPKGVYIVRD